MATKRLWTDTNGRIVCERHGGYYLEAAVKASPRARKHTTPITVWELLTKSDRDFLGQYARCESCG